MEINIIDFTSEQLSKLNNDQVADIKTAQLKKNRLERELAEKKRALKSKMLKNGTIRSDQFTLLTAELEQRYAMEIENIREGLLFYLQYTAKPSTSAPYTVDYSLSIDERLDIVWDYYNNTYPDAVEKYEAFIADTVAPSYLGEAYAGLKDNLYYAAYGVSG